MEFCYKDINISVVQTLILNLKHFDDFRLPQFAYFVELNFSAWVRSVEFVFIILTVVQGQ